MPRKRERKRLYLIGMDSTPVWLLDEFSGAKGMEPFARLLKKGMIVDMESTLPPMTGAAWPSIFTGLTPGEHGVPDFFVMKENYVPDLAFYDSHKVPPFWSVLSDRGMRSLVITPATDIKLPDRPNIDLITGFPLRSKASSTELEGLMRKYDFYGEPDIEKYLKSGKMSAEQATKKYVESIRARSEIAKRMMEKHDYDLVFVCFTETDRLQHFVLNKKNMREYLLPLYAEIAKFLAYVLERVEKEGAAVMLVSDHGAQPITNKFLINPWLVKNGYLVLKPGVVPTGAKTKSSSLAAYKMREKLVKTRLRRVYDKLPSPAKSAVFRAFGAFGKGAGAAAGGYIRLHISDFDMGKTKVFGAISNFPITTLWVNDERFVNGFVSQAEKKRLKRELTEKFKHVKSAEGDAMFTRVYDGDSYYHGTKKFIPPDLLVEAKPGYTIDVFNYSDATMFQQPEKPKSGDHTMQGIFGFYSPSAKARYTDVSVLNVAPTILDYFGAVKDGKRSVLLG